MASSPARARGALEHMPFAEGLVSRLSAPAAAQGKLVDAAQDFPLRELVADIVNAAGFGEVTVNVSGLPDCCVDASGMCVSAVVIGELTTNALKYAALRSGGAIRCEDSTDDTWLRISWLAPVDEIDLVDTEISSSANTG